MAQRFRKPVVPPGVFHSPDGQVTITPERIKGWVDRFKAMKADGIKIPVPWGHQPQAEPADAAQLAEREFYRSRFNATYLDDLEIDPTSGEMIAVGEVPPGWSLDDKGNLVNPADGLTVAEVSLAVCDWTDGKGKKWPDSVRHVALCTLPVAHGTGGFEPAAGEVRLSLSACQFRLATYEAAPATATTVVSPPVPKPVIDFAAKGPGEVGALVEQLGRCGVVLPADTSAENFIERLKIALTALEGKKADEPDPAQPDPAKKPAAPVVEEKPTMLSLATAKDPVTKLLLLRVAADDQAKRTARIAALAARTGPDGLPWLSPPEVQELEQRASKVEFSLTSEGQPTPNELDFELGLMEKRFRDFGGKVKEEPQPQHGQPGAARNLAVANEIARNVGLAVRT